MPKAHDVKQERQQLLDALRTLKAAYDGLDGQPDGISLPTLPPENDGWTYWPLWDAPQRVPTGPRYESKLIIDNDGSWQVERRYHRLLKLVLENSRCEVVSHNELLKVVYGDCGSIKARVRSVLKYLAETASEEVPGVRLVEERIARKSQLHRSKHHAELIIDNAIREAGFALNQLQPFTAQRSEAKALATVGSMLRTELDLLNRWKSHERLRLRGMQKDGETDVAPSNFDRLILQRDLDEVLEHIQTYVIQIQNVLELPQVISQYDVLGHWYALQIHAAGGSWKQLRAIRKRNRVRHKPTNRARRYLTWPEIARAKVNRPSTHIEFP